MVPQIKNWFFSRWRFFVEPQSFLKNHLRTIIVLCVVAPPWEKVYRRWWRTPGPSCHRRRTFPSSGAVRRSPGCHRPTTPTTGRSASPPEAERWTRASDQDPSGRCFERFYGVLPARGGPRRRWGRLYISFGMGTSQRLENVACDRHVECRAKPASSTAWQGTAVRYWTVRTIVVLVQRNFDCRVGFLVINVVDLSIHLPFLPLWTLSLYMTDKRHYFYTKKNRFCTHSWFILSFFLRGQSAKGLCTQET